MFELIGGLLWTVAETILGNPEIILAVVGGVTVLKLASKYNYLKKKFSSVVRNWLQRTRERLKIVYLKIVRSGRQYRQSLVGITQRDTQKKITEKTLTEDQILSQDIQPLADGKERAVYEAEELLELQT